jgi:hypothetical protein
MSDTPLQLSDVDVDGAIAESAGALMADTALEDAAGRGDTRAQMLRKAAVGGGALMGGGILLGLTGTASAAPSAKQDTEILNYALTLEYLEAAFYAEAVAKGALSGDDLLFAKTAADHEKAHVDFLKGALGAKAVASPTFDFKGTTADTTTFRNTAVVLEDTGVAAYLGQLTRFSKPVLTLIAGHILAVEARHAAWVRFLAKTRIPADDAFEHSKFVNGYPRGGYANMKQVLAVVKSTGFITG